MQLGDCLLYVLVSQKRHLHRFILKLVWISVPTAPAVPKLNLAQRRFITELIDTEAP